MDSLTGPLVTLLGAALAIYALLRIFALTPLTDRSGVETARIHAFWTGLIAWLTIGSTGLAQAGTWEGGQPSGEGFTGLLNPLATLLVPVVAVPALHILGQFTWPKHQRAVRRADLTIRTVGRFIPQRLAVVVVILFVVAAGVAVAVSSIPPVPPISGGPEDGAVQEQAGRIAGSTLSLALGISLAMLAAGVVAALHIIARRRPVETLSATNDTILRVISMNRLLRTAGLLLIMLIATGLGHATFPSRAWGDWSAIGHQIAILICLMVLLVLALWQPPRMMIDAPERTTGQLPLKIRADAEATAGRAMAVTAAAIGFLASFAVVNLIPVEGGHAHLRDHLFPVQFAVPAVVYLVMTMLYERRRRASDNRVNDLHTPGRAAPPLPLFALVVAVVGMVTLAATLIAVLAVSNAASSLLDANSAASVSTANYTPLDAPFPDGMFLLPTMIATTVLTGVAALTLIRVRKGSRGSGPAPDEAQALTHRILCAFGASCLAMAAAVLWGAGQRWMISAGYAPDSSVQEYTELVLTLMNLAMPAWFVAAIAAFTPAPVSVASEDQATAHSSP